MNKKFYITTTLPYVNADPHIGFALEIVQADALARFKRLQGYDVLFNFGTDEHGLKIYRKAVEEGLPPKKYCDNLVLRFIALKKTFNLSYTNFVRTTDPHHIKAAQEFWRRCNKNGDIYKKQYSTKYCVGCELEKTDSELVHGVCPLHPTQKIEFISEENYFFRFSKYQKPLLDLYTKNEDFVVPQYRFNEIISFVKSGLNDFSISRLKSKMPWGVPVPDDDKHVMYVWFDALINYISTLGWPENIKQFEAWWPAVQFAGTDNLRPQSAMWQAMLMSSNLPPSKQIFIHGFINSNGKKMSKSLGNVVNPFTEVEKYGTDAVRYYLLREIPSHSDGDYTTHRFLEVYNADLSNNLGNLVSRIIKLSITNNVTLTPFIPSQINTIIDEITPLMETFQFSKAIEKIIEYITNANKYLDETAPWNQKERDAKITIARIIEGDSALVSLRTIAEALLPFLPQTGEEILKRFGGKTVQEGSALFPKIV